ncbi:MAG: hypothetical protein R2681_07865 [Pyrinomonadaceae bacterium]
MIFRTKTKDYYGWTALEIVRAMESDARDYPHRGQSIKQFLRWSLNRLGDRLPHRELDLSSRLEDETLALSFLHLCDEYGAGKIIRMPKKFKNRTPTLKQG